MTDTGVPRDGHGVGTESSMSPGFTHTQLDKPLKSGTSEKKK